MKSCGPTRVMRPKSFRCTRSLLLGIAIYYECKSMSEIVCIDDIRAACCHSLGDKKRVRIIDHSAPRGMNSSPTNHSTDLPLSPLTVLIVLSHALKEPGNFKIERFRVIQLIEGTNITVLLFPRKSLSRHLLPEAVPSVLHPQSF